MKFYVEDTEKSQKAYKTLLLKDPQVFSVLSNKLAQKILKELSNEPMCAMDIARRLKEHEQKIYYHIRKLEKIGIIKIDRVEERVGAVAKIYSVVSPTISFKIHDGKPIQDFKTKTSELKLLDPFVKNGKLNAMIIAGSPEPHGRYKYAASDGYCAINLAMFLGEFIKDVKLPCYKLDTQIKDDDLKKNIIVLGGPKANIFTDKVNDKLPIYFNRAADWNIVSSLSRNVYREEYIGFIVRMPSPFCEGKEMMVLAGNRFDGTRAAVLALTRYPKKVMEGNSINPEIIANVVTGVDVDGDGIVDEVDFLE